MLFQLQEHHMQRYTACKEMAWAVMSSFVSGCVGQTWEKSVIVNSSSLRVAPSSCSKATMGFLGRDDRHKQIFRNKRIVTMGTPNQSNNGLWV